MIRIISFNDSLKHAGEALYDVIHDGQPKTDQNQNLDLALRKLSGTFRQRVRAEGLSEPHATLLLPGLHIREAVSHVQQFDEAILGVTNFEESEEGIPPAGSQNGQKAHHQNRPERVTGEAYFELVHQFSSLSARIGPANPFVQDSVGRQSESSGSNICPPTPQQGQFSPRSVDEVGTEEIHAVNQPEEESPREYFLRRTARAEDSCTPGRPDEVLASVFSDDEDQDDDDDDQEEDNFFDDDDDEEEEE